MSSAAKEGSLFGSDLDGDGFPDVHITETTRRADPEEGDVKYPPSDRRYLYDPVRDGYLSAWKPFVCTGTPSWKDPNDP